MGFRVGACMPSDVGCGGVQENVPLSKLRHHEGPVKADYGRALRGTTVEDYKSVALP